LGRSILAVIPIKPLGGLLWMGIGHVG